MADAEQLFLPREISERTGGAITPEAVRDACRRRPEDHPLPHVKIGSKRPVLRIRWGSWLEWVKEEERISSVA